MSNVEFSGDADIALDLDAPSMLAPWASKTWEILLVLDDYCLAKTEGRLRGDVHTCLERTPVGYRSWSVRRHGKDESENVKRNPEFAKKRVLPVPISMHPDGCVAMWSHFKIAQAGQISPRLHYVDDTRRSGKIYVGYIGPHLPTKHTN